MVTMVRKSMKSIRRKGRTTAFLLVIVGTVMAGFAAAPAQAAVAKAQPGTTVSSSTAPGASPKTGTSGTPAVTRVRPGTKLALPAGLRPTRTRVPASPGTGAKPGHSSTVNAPMQTGWSGYVQTGGTYTSVSATWTVPSVSSSGSTTSYAATWVGIDGYSNGDLIQTGISENWDGETDAPVYQAWWEILPAGPTDVFDVSPGDIIYASVSQVSGTEWQIFLFDRTNGELFDQDETYSGPESSAEFIQEDPLLVTSTGAVEYAPLADFSEVTFANARVNGQSPSFGSDTNIPMYENGTYLAVPSAPSQAGNSFDVTYGSATPAAPATPLVFLRHTDGSVYTCYSSPCSSGWGVLDTNNATTSISAGAGTVFELHNNGQIWEWTGQGCTSSSCPGWIELDDNTAATAIAAGAGTVFELHNDGSVWRSTGQACDGASCPGWTELDSGQSVSQISAGGGSLYAQSSNGQTWEWTASAGWVGIGYNTQITQIVATASTVYALTSTGLVWQYQGSGNWVSISSNSNITALAANSSEVWELYSNGEIWEYTGNGGWTLIADSGSGDVEITASTSTVYTLTSAGVLWQFQPSAEDWLSLDNYSGDTQITALNGG
jgi:hypothetical protein